MSSLNVDADTKARFDELQPEDSTQAEFVKLLLESYEQHGDGIDPMEWADRVAEALEEPVGNAAELGAYRGTTDAIESTEL